MRNWHWLNYWYNRANSKVRYTDLKTMEQTQKQSGSIISVSSQQPPKIVPGPAKTQSSRHPVTLQNTQFKHFIWKRSRFPQHSELHREGLMVWFRPILSNVFIYVFLNTVVYYEHVINSENNQA